MFHVVIHRSGPEWDAVGAVVRATLAHDPWSESRLRIDAVEACRIRLDGRPHLSRRT